MTNNYMDGTFRSCSKVSVPSTGKLALDLMCGEWGAYKCTAKRWFTFMGDATSNLYVPFQITYMNTSVPVGDFTPFDPKVYSCGEAPDVSAFMIDIDGIFIKMCFRKRRRRVVVWIVRIVVRYLPRNRTEVELSV